MGHRRGLSSNQVSMPFQEILHAPLWATWLGHLVKTAAKERYWASAFRFSPAVVHVDTAAEQKTEDHPQNHVARNIVSARRRA